MLDKGVESKSKSKKERGKVHLKLSWEVDTSPIPQPEPMHHEGSTSKIASFFHYYHFRHEDPSKWIHSLDDIQLGQELGCGM